MAELKNTTRYHAGIGRRKSAVAVVRLYAEGTGTYTVNGKTVEAVDQVYLEPLKLVGKFGTADLSIKVEGGGFNGQAEAARHGVARALVELNPEFKTTLKKAGYLTRDSREKERKKPGLKSARRAPQWSKR
jgi:small subunit ribosomal protein S9